MTPKPLLLLAMLPFFFSACSEDKATTEEKTTAIEKVETPAQAPQPAPDTTGTSGNLIINNNLTNSWVRALNNLNIENFTADKKPFTNRHNPAITDTILTLQHGQTTVDFYRTPNNDMLQSARIHDNTIQLSNQVKIGMPKSELEKILNTKIPGNNVQVSDEERFSTFRFTFAADTLQQVIFEGYVD